MYAAGKPIALVHTSQAPINALELTALAMDHRNRHNGYELSLTETMSAMLRADAGGLDRKAVHERLEREKRQNRKKAEAKSAKLKDEGNTAFKNNDLKMAYVLYTACMHLSIRDTLYPLNRAAVALSPSPFDILFDLQLITKSRIETLS
jgi:hypothetical protein